MSTTIDNRVLEMQFDNAQFERNVATSMSTLDKLKQKLNLSGASKNLDGLTKAANNADLSGLSKGVEVVNAKFSAMQVIGMTALANITNSAINTGKRMISALTIDPVKTGLQEYETQINSVQTILSNTRQEGTNVEIVNKALDELNEYADKTIYNFTEMTRNIGTFTAAGVKLDTSVSAIKGIANLAAVSGSTSQQASVAMYQLSQALAAGKIQLMDWNSVVNAGMGGKVFQDALIRTSELLGTGAKAAIEAEGSFRESLTSTGWLTTEVLTETLKQLANTYSKAELMAQGYTEAQADEIVALAVDAEEAATKVKTVTQLWDVLKEAAQSGWSQTWRTIIGDFEDARTFWTHISDVLTGIIGKFSDFRNNIISGVMVGNIFKFDGNVFENVSNSINKILSPAKDVSDAVEKVTDSFVNLDDIAGKVIGGEFGNGQERFNKLAEAGYNWCEVQNKVNETLGNSYRYTKEQIKAQGELLGSQKKTTESNKEEAESTEEVAASKFKLSEENKKMLKDMADLGGKLESSNKYTKEQIEAFRQLESVSQSLGVPIKDFIDNIEELNGRFFLLNGIQNIGRAIGETFKAIGKGWISVFGEFDQAGAIDSIFNTTVAFSQLTASIIPTAEEADQLRRIFAGLFAAIDLVTSVIGGGFRLILSIAKMTINAFDTSVLELLATIGDSIVKFRKFAFELNPITIGLNKLIKLLPEGANKFKEWFDIFKEIPAVKNLASYINNIKDAISKFSLGDIDITDLASRLGANLANMLKTLPNIALQIGKDFITGFQNGITSSSAWDIVGKIVSFALEFVASFAEALGVQSPSWKAFEIATDFIQGFIDGIKGMVSQVTETLMPYGEKIVGVFNKIMDGISNLSFEQLFAVGMTGSMLYFIKRLTDSISDIASAFGGFEDLLSGVETVMTSFSKVFKGIALDYKAKAMQKFAIAIAILAASLIVLANVPLPQLGKAVGILVLLSALLLGLAIAMSKLSAASVSIGKDGANIDGLKAGLLNIAIAIGIMAVAVAALGKMDPEEANDGFIRLAVLAVGMLAFMAAIAGISHFAKDVGPLNSLIAKLAITMILMVGVVKLASGLTVEEMLKGTAFAAAFALFVISITKVAKSSGNNVGKVGTMLIKLTIAMGLMVGVVKLVDSLSAAEMLKGAAFASAFVIFVKFLAKATAIGGKQQTAKLAGIIISISASLLLLVGVCKLVNRLSVNEMLKGALFMTGFTILLKALVTILKISNEEQIAQVSSTILAMSVAIGILAAVCILLGAMDIDVLVKGVTIVGILGIIMSTMIKATRGTQDVMKNLIAMAAAIGIMAVAVAALSFIDASKLAGASIALSMVMGMFALMAKCAGTMGKVAVPIMIMTAAVAALAGVLYLLSSLEVGSTIEVASSLSMLMLSMAVAIRIIATTGSVALAAIPAMACMVLILGGVAAVLGIMSHFDITPSLETASALSLLLLSMAAVTAILSTVGSNVAGALLGVASLAIVVAGVAGILVALGALNSKFKDMETFIDEGIPLMEKIGAGIGRFVGGIIGGLGEGVTSSLPKMGHDIADLMSELATASDNASGIDGTSFDGVKQLMGVLSDIGLTTVGTTFADIFTLGGTSMDKFKSDGITFFTAMKEISAKASGTSIIGEIPTEGITGLLTAIKEIGKTSVGMSFADIFSFEDTAMEKFETDAIAFFAAMKSIATEASGTSIIGEIPTEGLVSLLTAIKEIGKTAVGMSFADIFSFGETAMDKFESDGVAFFAAMKSIATEASGSTESLNSIDSFIDAASRLAEFESTLTGLEGFISFFASKTDLGDFGTNIGLFADGMTKLKNGMGEEGITESVVTSVTNAGEAILALQDALPTEGWFDGKMSLSTFSGYVTSFSNAMSTFSDMTNNLKIEGINIAILAANRVRNFIGALADLDTSGLSVFIGGAMSDGALVNIGQAVSRFSNTVADINVEAVNTSVSAAHKIKTLISGLIGLDTSGLENFKVDEVGAAMKAYSDKVAGINVEAVSSSVSSANRLKTLISSLAGLDTSGIGKFKIASLGSSLKVYSSNISGFDAGAVTKSILSATMIKTFINSLSGINVSGVAIFKKAIDDLSTVELSGLVDAFSGASENMLSAGEKMMNGLASGIKSKTGVVKTSAISVLSATINEVKTTVPKFESAGKAFMTRMSGGITSTKGAVISAASSCMTSALNAVSGYYGRFFTMGVFAGSGLAAGIKSQIQSAANAAAQMAQAAVNAARENLKINSPSKVFKEIGSGVPEGFAMGIAMLGGSIKRSVSSMTDTIITSAQKAMLRVNDFLTSDLDTEPTIRPVLDLSDIKSGASALNGIFDSAQTVGVMANLGMINRSMNARGQNGTNMDVVSAIDKLRKDLGNISGTTYNVNGITYDDGSNVSEAIKSIVRAARIERRV